MKVILLNKKTLLFSCFSFIIFLFIIIYFIHPLSFAVELTKNSTMNSSLVQRISLLTKETQKVAYLTFDDGPSKKSTEKILDILKDEKIKATFFVIGKHVKKYPDIIKREYEEGHYIANHGYYHDNKKLYQNTENFLLEIQNTDKEIGKAINIDNYCSYVFRFPNGYMSSYYKNKKKEAAELLSTINYAYIDWNCLNEDSVRKYTHSQLLSNLKKSAKNKGTLVVLMHDTSDVNDTPSILKDSINYLKSEGYEFKNFYDLII